MFLPSVHNIAQTLEPHISCMLIFIREPLALSRARVASPLQNLYGRSSGVHCWSVYDGDLARSFDQFEGPVKRCRASQCRQQLLPSSRRFSKPRRQCFALHLVHIFGNTRGPPAVRLCRLIKELLHMIWKALKERPAESCRTPGRSKGVRCGG